MAGELGEVLEEVRGNLSACLLGDGGLILELKIPHVEDLQVLLQYLDGFGSPCGRVCLVLEHIGEHRHHLLNIHRSRALHILLLQVYVDEVGEFEK